MSSQQPLDERLVSDQVHATQQQSLPSALDPGGGPPGTAASGCRLPGLCGLQLSWLPPSGPEAGLTQSPVWKHPVFTGHLGACGSGPQAGLVREVEGATTAFPVRCLLGAWTHQLSF